ncbi:DUF5343 domain-containing protein [Balneolaceae bacterium YR4-1]|uniref:DUF5343 domain-containing protein n=1 Tax=Halalkalibaculum roseum TaxID=2709311 RepID=A0A6M1SVZ4_9BACT|nr:DUF5343 domain-containing protein [Halalkalibaculum roseum]NGP76308.1 DUF5343 domain-containing protein [Halalkalibaculum roseum]
MGISENFLVNTKSFDPIIQALISRSEHPDTISDTTLEKMGYDNPSDLLVLHVLRGLDIIHQDKTPSDLYFKMVDPDHTKEAIAEGVINGYMDLFLENPDIHKRLPGEIQEELKEYFEGKKTDLIVKYIANTFHKLVSYAGIDVVEEARDRMLGEELKTASADADENIEIDNEIEVEVESEATTAKSEGADSAVKETNNNGKSGPDFHAASEQEEISSRSVEEILFGDKPDSKEQEESDIKDETDASDKDKAAADLSKAEQSEEWDESGEEDGSIQEFKASDSSYDDDDLVGEETAKNEPAGRSDTGALPGKYDISLSHLDTSDERIQKAIVRRAELLDKLGHNREALESYEDMISYFDDADESFLQEAVSQAVIRRVELVKKLNQEHKLLPALNEVIRRFSSSDDSEYYERASKAMLQKAELLETKDYDGQDLLPLYNQIINRLEDESDPYIQEKVNEIFIRRLTLLNRADDNSELLKALDQSITRFGENPRFRKYLEETMFRKAEILEHMNRIEDALDAYTSFLQEFGETVDS